jgi:diphthine-ammonia ligase
MNNPKKLKLAVLFSGGKDSTYALYKAMKKENVICLISIISENEESYMFHTPNINITKYQAKSLNLPLISITTKGEKENELLDLKNAIIKAKEKYNIEGIVTGAIESIYQASRIQKICNELNLWCFNPLWKKEQIELLKELVENKFKIVIIGAFAYPFDESWLGKEINEETINKLIEFKNKYQINPAGEGGEIETLAIDGPIFNNRIVIKTAKKEFSQFSGVLKIKKIEIIKK